MLQQPKGEFVVEVADRRQNSKHQHKRERIKEGILLE